MGGEREKGRLSIDSETQTISIDSPLDGGVFIETHDSDTCPAENTLVLDDTVSLENEIACEDPDHIEDTQLVEDPNCTNVTTLLVGESEEGICVGSDHEETQRTLVLIDNEGVLGEEGSIPLKNDGYKRKCKEGGNLSVVNATLENDWDRRNNVVDSDASTDDEVASGNSISYGSPCRQPASMPKSGSSQRSFASVRAASLRASGLSAAQSMGLKRPAYGTGSLNQEGLNALGDQTRGKAGNPRVRKLFVEDELAENGNSIRKFNSLGDEETNSSLLPGHCTAGLSYLNSQEPGELSQAEALGVVDKLVSVNGVGLSQPVEPGKTGDMKAALNSSVKGAQTLAKLADLRNPTEKIAIFDWDDNREDGRGGIFSSKRKEAFFQNGKTVDKALTEPHKNKRALSKGPKGLGERLREKEEERFSYVHQGVLNFAHSDSRVVLSGSSSGHYMRCAKISRNLFKDLEEHPSQVPLGQEPASPVRFSQGTYDVGFDTQMAAEAIEALGCVPPVTPTNQKALTNPTKGLRKSNSRSKSKAGSKAKGKIGSDSRRVSVRKRGCSSIDSDYNLRKSKQMKTLDDKSREADHIGFSRCRKKPIAKAVEPKLTGEREANQQKFEQEERTAKLSELGIRERRKPQLEKKEKRSFDTLSNEKPAGTNLLKETLSSYPKTRAGKRNSSERNLNSLLSVAGCVKNLEAVNQSSSARRKRSTNAAKTTHSQTCVPNKDSIEEIFLNPGTRKTRSASKSSAPLITVSKDVPTKAREATTHLSPAERDSMDGISCLPSEIDGIDGVSDVPIKSSVRIRSSRNPSSRLLSPNPTSMTRQQTPEHSFYKNAANHSAALANKDQLHNILSATTEKKTELAGSVCSTPLKGTDAVSPICMGDGAHRSFTRDPGKSTLRRELIRLDAAEPEVSPTLKSAGRRKRYMSSVRVLFSHHLDDDIVKQQKKILARLGACSTTSSPSDATHFVTDKFVRTRNMLETMALGKPVVTHLWLENCGQASCFLDEKKYILRDTKKEKEIGFSMPASLNRASQSPLLQGKRVMVTPSVKPNRDLVAYLIKALNGQVVERLGKSAIKDDKILKDILVISCEEDYIFSAPLLEKGARAYTSELILNGIVIQKLEYERHHLFEDHVKRLRSSNLVQSRK
ncbi:uncharacterized protein LOC18445180 isoform X1 [Amborella trichopoda]|uniref:BRCT domain-containing protein n=2 Tax=Amborella trichopoda TaxID=13333 RepID=U5D5Z4_AMBTC|nr:uncharacterized protein LOC18445180 isoform X1 [Amborella trichopoda]XP_020529793.1 uncharacterized protein LOC18445180 isoform X1 [Amborella trichopoda]ERN16852.1 hypothetical protein AMTR_s00057p00134990 [Amborella trichopoda]|eukprot:XP_020529792.1 uncharacterized protein LOC18445180 isoform X1 [Amborella trichopoda]